MFKNKIRHVKNKIINNLCILAPGYGHNPSIKVQFFKTSIQSYFDYSTWHFNSNARNAVFRDNLKKNQMRYDAKNDTC